MCVSGWRDRKIPYGRGGLVWLSPVFQCLVVERPAGQGVLLYLSVHCTTPPPLYSKRRVPCGGVELLFHPSLSVVVQAQFHFPAIVLIRQIRRLYRRLILCLKHQFINFQNGLSRDNTFSFKPFFYSSFRFGSTLFSEPFSVFSYCFEPRFYLFFARRHALTIRPFLRIGKMIYSLFTKKNRVLLLTSTVFFRIWVTCERQSDRK